MLEIHRGQRSEPNPPRNSSQSAFSRFQVSLGGARQERLIAIDIASWLENEIQQDIDPTYNIGSRWDIDEVLVSDAVNFVEQVVETIHQIL